MAVAHEIASGRACLHSDSHLVTGLWAEGDLQAHSLYAGVVKYALGQAGAKSVESVSWAKGHVDPESVQGAAKRHAIGNQLADEGADVGRESHPPPLTTSSQKSLDVQFRHATLVLDTIAAVWLAFPAQVERGPRAPGARRPARVSVRDVDRHQWSSLGPGAGWRCVKCWTTARADSDKKTRARAGCKPLSLARALEEDLEAHSKTHRLVAARLEDNQPLVICLVCGGWGMRRAPLLSKPCRGAHKGGGEAIRRVSKGLHPHSNYKVKLKEQIHCGELGTLYQIDSGPSAQSVFGVPPVRRAGRRTSGSGSPLTSGFRH